MIELATHMHLTSFLINIGHIIIYLFKTYTFF